MKKYVKHIIKEGSREHVLSWDSNGRRCSCKDCEVNKEREVKLEVNSNYPFNVVLDESMPKDEIWIEDCRGRILGKLKNVGMEI